MQNDNSRQWGAVVPFVPVEVLTQQAQQMEAAGFAGIQAPSIYGPPWIPLAAAAAVTSRVQLASGIAQAFVRSPFETAMAAMDLDRMSGGRFTLGLGPTVRAWSEGIYGMPGYGKPVEHLKETVEVVRHIIAKSHTGELTTFKGKYWNFDWSEFQGAFAPPVRDKIPIWLAANQMGLVRLAAEVAEGFINHPIWSIEWTLNRGLPTLKEALSKAGRERSDIHWNDWIWVAINNDRADAINDAKATVAFYAGVSQYEPFFAAHGFEKEARACQEAVKQGQYTTAGASAVTDEMAETFVVLGSADDVRKKIEQVWDVVDSFLLLPPIGGVPPEKFMFYLGTIAETFYS